MLARAKTPQPLVSPNNALARDFVGDALPNARRYHIVTLLVQLVGVTRAAWRLLLRQRQELVAAVLRLWCERQRITRGFIELGTPNHTAHIEQSNRQKYGMEILNA